MGGADHETPNRSKSGGLGGVSGGGISSDARELVGVFIGGRGEISISPLHPVIIPVGVQLSSESEWVGVATGVRATCPHGISGS